jgi:hypothetical protein
MLRHVTGVEPPRTSHRLGEERTLVPVRSSKMTTSPAADFASPEWLELTGRSH